MVKVAFTSCMLQQYFPKQPVWKRIKAADPDYVVLLGDSIYLDIDANPRKMSDADFGVHAHARYRAQLAVPEFDELLRHMAAKGGRRTFAIWDDHDFLWNDSAGAPIAKIPADRDKIPLSRALFGQFQQALLQVGSFPAQVVAKPAAPASPVTQPLFESVELADKLWLHLTDGRTFRTETILVGHKQRAILGAAQLAWLHTQVMDAPSDAVHLVASGSTSSTWKRYDRDWKALNAIADQRRVLMLSGDVHNNGFAEHVDPMGLRMFEATASGAAIRDAIVVGERIENFAVAEIDELTVRLRFFEKSGERQPWTILRANWTL